MNRKLKVAVWFDLPPGGARRAVYDQVKGLVGAGHVVQVFHPPIDHPEWMNPADLTESAVAPIAFAHEGDGYLNRVLNHLKRQTLLMKSAENHADFIQILVDLWEPDVLLCHPCRNYYAPTLGQRLPDIPKVLYLQEPNRFLYEALPELPWTGIGAETKSWRGKLRQKLDQKFLRRQAQFEHKNASGFDQILVNSYYSRESVMRAYGLDSRVCYLGVDTSVFKPKEVAAGDPYILGIGAFVPTKRVLLAVEAVAAMKNKVPLRWIGPVSDPIYSTVVREIARRTGVQLEWQELVSEEELIAAYQGARAVLFLPQLEPFGYVPIEAMACGVPVVGIAEGGLRETLIDGENGLVVRKDEVEIAAALDRLVEDAAYARQLGTQGRTIAVERWDAVDATARLEAELLRVIEKKSSS